MKRHLLVPFALAGFLTVTAAHASYPAGVWVKVQRVELEPKDTNSPTRIRIYGAVLLYKGSTEPVAYLDTYTPPALGYLYYQCPAGDSTTCLQEWNDIQANIAAPIEKCVGLGDQTTPTGTLRATNDVPSNPDAYPIAMGVLEGYTPCQALADFLKMQADGGAGTGGAANTGGRGSGGAPAGGGTSAAGGAGGANAGGQTAAAGAKSNGTGGKTGSGGATGTGGETGTGGRTGASAPPESGGTSSASGGSTASSGGSGEEEETPTKASKTSADKGCNVTREPRSPWTFGSSLLGIAMAWAARRRRAR